MKVSLPRVLCISGHDPSGGAGIHADIEAVAANGGHALTVITATTVQDSQNVAGLRPVRAAWMAEQIDLLERDGPIGAIKLGLIGDDSQVALIADLIARHRVPVVLDPVLRAGGGTRLVRDDLIGLIRNQLLPLITVLTPNGSEAARLCVPNQSERPTTTQCADQLLDLGCESILITGGDDRTEQVENHFFERGRSTRVFRWKRHPETFHGAGCTLASAIACQLALGASPAQAVSAAQTWTQQTLSGALRVGRGRRIPARQIVRS